jgi:hypothetical protein
VDYNKICKDIINLDSSIRYAGICDDTGDIKFGGIKDGINSIFTPEETRKSNQQAIGRWGLRNAFTPKTGKGKYAMAEYERIKRVTMPINENYLLLVTMEVESDHNIIINQILKMIEQ